MRILALAILAIGMVSAAGQARAQTYDPAFPVCMHVAVWGGPFEDCTYYTMAQCASRLPAARASATSTRITRAQQRRRDETTGGIAAVY